MGIKELNPFLKKMTPDCIEECDLCFFRGKKVAIDTSIYLYKYLYGNGNYLEKFIQQIVRLRLNNITPVYIFDGKPPEEKQNEILQRQKRKQNLKDKIENLQIMCDNVDDNDLKKDLEKSIKKNQLRVINVKKEHIVGLKYLLDLMNIKYIQADCEADVVCSNLYKNKLVDLVLSDDMDLLACGANMLMRNFSVNSNKILVYDVNKIKSKLDISHDQWVDFCILCGCDYVKRIKGMGPLMSYKYIKAYKSIEGVINNMVVNSKKYKLPNDYDYKKARNLFNSTDGYKEEYNNLDINVNDLFQNQLLNIKKYLVKTTRFNEEQINKKLSIIYKKD